MLSAIRRMLGREDGSPRLYSLDCQNKTSVPGSKTRTAEADDVDLSYEDALLDAQLRLFFDAEYSSVDPPPGVLYNVLSQIANERQIAASPLANRAGWLPQLVASMHRALTSPSMVRLVPGAVALLLLAGTLGSDVSRILRSDSQLVYRESVTSLVVTPTPPHQFLPDLYQAPGKGGIDTISPPPVSSNLPASVVASAPDNSGADYDPIEGRTSPRFLAPDQRTPWDHSNDEPLTARSGAQ